MPYQDPQRVTLSYNAVNIGAGNSTRVFRTPKGKRGSVSLVMAGVTTSFVGTATPGKVQVGDGVTANKYADLAIGAAGAGTAAAHAVTASDYGSGLLGRQPGVPALFLEPDTEYTITFVAPVGGAPAGVADVQVQIDFF